jgi:hypothetical protein
LAGGVIFYGFLFVFGLADLGIAIALAPTVGISLAALIIMIGLASMFSSTLYLFDRWRDTRYRFSLRTLLIAMTVFGLLLGTIIATTR